MIWLLIGWFCVIISKLLSFQLNQWIFLLFLNFLFKAVFCWFELARISTANRHQATLRSNIITKSGCLVHHFSFFRDSRHEVRNQTSTTSIQIISLSRFPNRNVVLVFPGLLQQKILKHTNLMFFLWPNSVTVFWLLSTRTTTWSACALKIFFFWFGW